MRHTPERTLKLSAETSFISSPQGYDPELLIVECARCGLPVLWERGRSTAILAGAGIDPLELDVHCLLLTDGCPQCSPGVGGFTVQVFRVVPAHGGFGLKPVGSA